MVDCNFLCALDFALLLKFSFLLDTVLMRSSLPTCKQLRASDFVKQGAIKKVVFKDTHSLASLFRARSSANLAIAARSSCFLNDAATVLNAAFRLAGVDTPSFKTASKPVQDEFH